LFQQVVHYRGNRPGDGMKMIHGKNCSCMSKKMRLAAMIVAGFGAALLSCARAYAQSEPPLLEIEEADRAAKQAACDLYGWCGGGTPPKGPRIVPPDPCFLAQNAMRPCTSNQAQANGLDPNLVGTWELPFKGGPWVLEIQSNGTYKFHSEANDSVPPSTGRFSAGNGHWSLSARNGNADFGDYLYQAPAVFVATGQHGAVAWLRPVLAQTVMRPCAAKQPGAKPASVDPHLVGTWKLPIRNGFWVWEISASGTYKFHSEAGDGTPSHTGSFSTRDGHWSLNATTGLPGYTDSGLYLFQAPNVWMATGQLGGAAWLNAAACTPAL
jgi:hypothetical protein